MASNLSKSQTFVFRVLNAQQNITVLELWDWCLVLDLDWKDILLKMEHLNTQP